MLQIYKLDSDITLEEVNSSLNWCKNNKAPGYYRVANGFLAALPEN